MRSRWPHPYRTHAAGLRGASLVEVAMASLLVGVLLIAALNAVGARLRHQSMLTNRQIAFHLGQQLLAEVLENPYSDPDQTPAFGAESGETGGTREAFDDVDDFHGWDATPPESRDGNALPNRTGWRRKVIVEHVKSSDLLSTAAADEGFKRIAVEVYWNGELLATVSTVRTSAWEFSP